MSDQQTVILAILVVYLLFNAAAGIYFSKRSARRGLSGEKQYFIGSRRMGGLLLAMTMMATYTSVSSFVSGPGAAGLTYGYAQVWVAAVQVPVTFLVLGVLGNKLAIVSRRTGAVTVAGYLKARYKNDALVIVTSLLMVAFFMAQMIGQFTGGATLIASITGLDFKWALVIFGVGVILYTAFGGFTAVAVTDTIQGIIMCVGTFLFLFFVLRAGGGLSGIDQGLQQNLPGVYDDLFAKYSPGSLLKGLHQAMWIGVLTSSFVIVGMHLAGAWAGALVDTADLPTSDYFVPYIVQKIMPTGIAGIFLAAPMAAVMSTADSILLKMSAAIVKDLWRTYVVRDDPKRIQRYEKHVGFAGTMVTVVMGIAVLLLTLDPPEIIFFLNLFAFGGLECTFFWPLLGGLFWKRGNGLAACVSSAGAAVTYVLCYYFVKVAGINAVIWGLLAGGILYFATGLLTSKIRSYETA